MEPLDPLVMSMNLGLESSPAHAEPQEGYVVLARKWRPKQFSDIVGQTHVVRTLMNAIRAERLHHAYLFTGTRGTGKTSVARIFSKVLRCEKTAWVKGRPADGTTAEIDFLRSCDQCSSCREIAASSSVDVIEIDGASNNGVDSVREIRENVRYMPATGRRKITIIDEVHMLTTAAFNALLKTLEEPPAHVTFIFATTEPHKIPPTILSRVQRFDFRRVTQTQIQNRLAFVLKAEGFEAEAGALPLIARAAEGSMRDSLSLLDQVIAFSGSQITAQAVRDSVGLVEAQTLLGILQGIVERKPLEALALIEQAYAQGHDLRVLTRSLVEFLHGVILAKAGVPNTGSLEFSDDQWQELKGLAERRPLEELELIFQALHHGVEWIARSPQPKIILDVLIIKCAMAEALGYPNESAPTPAARSSGTVQPPLATAASTPSATPAAPSAPLIETVPGARAAAEIRASLSSIVSRPAGAAPKVAAADGPAVAKVEAKPRATNPTWEGFIEAIRHSRPLLASILEHGNCESFPLGEPFVLAIVYDPKESYYREQLQARVYHDQLVAIAKEYFGRAVPVRIESRETQGAESMAARKGRELKVRELEARSAAENHPTIREARAIFGGEIGPIELTDPEHAN